MFSSIAVSGQATVPTPPGTTAGSVVDSSTVGPGNAPPPATAPADASAEASPVSGMAHTVYLPVNTEIDVHLHQAANSASTHNDQILEATLAAPVRTSDGQTLPAGTPVKVTVLAAAAAGKLESRGELTLQVTQVGSISALSDAQTFFGKEGHKDLPDAAPAKGTEASVASGATLKFHVAPTK